MSGLISKYLPALCAAILLCGCASGGGSARNKPGVEPASGGVYTTGVKLQPVASVARSDSALPQLSVAQISDASSGVRRIQRFEAVDQDLRTVVRALAESFGMSYQVDPQVGGTVTTSLQSVTLEEALASVVLPHGYSYQIENGVLRVGAAKVQTRIFTLDYVALSRIGSTSTTIQRRLSSAGVGGGGGGGSGADVISSTSVADLWQEIGISLNGLLFDAASGRDSGQAAITSSGTVANTSGQQQSSAGASSRSTSDGRRLIINPLAGTILVSASPAKLAEVGAFITAFESSVLRQVLIEAKIVEVSLSKKYQFGIDWSLIASKGKLAFAAGGGALPQGSGTTSLTLGGGQNQLNAVMTLLQSQGTVSVLSSPRVSALNNQRANFNVTRDEIFFSVTRQPIIGPNGATIGFNQQINPQQISVGIVLDVLPQIGPDNTITMNIRPAVTSIARIERIQLEDGTEASAPVIDRRETDTMIRVRGGETVVIGGLMQTRRDKNTSGVPVLKDIPGIGKIFTTVQDDTQKDELVIFLTPTIMAGSPAAAPASTP